MFSFFFSPFSPFSFSPFSHKISVISKKKFLQFQGLPEYFQFAQTISDLRPPTSYTYGIRSRRQRVKSRVSCPIRKVESALGSGHVPVLPTSKGPWVKLKPFLINAHFSEKSLLFKISEHSPVKKFMPKAPSHLILSCRRPKVWSMGD